MATVDPFSTLSGPRRAAFFEPYARLIQVLCPRARGVVFYDATGNAVWQKDADHEESLSGQVRALLQEAADPEKGGSSGSERLLQDSTPAYLLWLRDDRGTALGILGVTSKPASGRMTVASIEEIEKTLNPVLQCLGRELAALRRAPSPNQDQLTARLQQAEWLTDKALPLVNSSTHAEPLRELLASIVERTDSALGAVVLPECAIRLVVESVGWSGDAAKDALKRAHEQVLSWMQSERRTFLTSQVRDHAAALAYHMIATPILQRPDHPIGYVALLRSPFATDFSATEQEVLERVSPLIPTLIERDYDSMTNLRSAAGLDRASRYLFTSKDVAAASSVIFIDIVGLGALNQELGAPEADRIIRQVAKLLRPPQLPEDALSARLGGGHFACLLPRVNVEDAGEIAAQIRAAAAKSDPPRRRSNGRIELRTGVAEITPTAAGLRYALIAARSAADSTAPAAASPSATTRAAAPKVQESSRLAIPVRLREALRDSRLKLFAQPMRPVRDPKKPVRIELLPRIVDESGNLIPPVEFLASGPDPDALTELDRWVMSTALDAIAAHSADLSTRAVEFSLNISARSTEMVGFHEWLAEQLRSSVVPAEQWLFEVAETTAANQRRDVARFAKRVLRAGARIAIDNVGGTAGGIGLQAHGASSIKMDGSLIRDVVSDARARRLVEALAQWASASRMDTVAGQVESEPVRDWLVQAGIDYIQGYVVCRPQPIEDVLKELLDPDTLSVEFDSQSASG